MPRVQQQTAAVLQEDMQLRGWWPWQWQRQQERHPHLQRQMHRLQ
jgi:hypothetical protein